MYTLENISTFFKYSPPRTEDRVARHEAVNAACLQLAQVLLEQVKDSNLVEQAIGHLQQARMFANLGITIAEDKDFGVIK